MTTAPPKGFSEDGLSSTVLGVHPVTRSGSELTADMPTGAWLTDRDGRAVPGALGFVADHVTAWAILDAVEPGRSSVSADILLDFLRPFPTDGPLLTTHARLVTADALGGLATGEILDDAGHLVAMVRQRGRWVPLPERVGPRGGAGFSPEVIGLAARSASIDDYLGATRTRTPDGATVTFAVAEQVQNSLGMLHGGAALLGADLAATTAFGPDSPLVTSSIHTNYLRPTPADDVATFTATVVHRGRTVGIARVVGTASHGKPCTVSTVTFQSA